MGHRLPPGEYLTWLAGVVGRLKAARVRLGLTVRTAGELVKAHYGTISRVESGDRPPTMELLFALAKGYGVPLCDLLCPPPPADPRPPARPKKK